MSAPDDELVEAVARAINSADNEWAGAPRTAPHEPWPHAVARAVLSVPALRDALTEAAANEGEMLQLIDQRAGPPSGALPPPTAVEQAWLDEHPAPPLTAEQARRTGVLLRAGIEQAKTDGEPVDVEQAS